MVLLLVHAVKCSPSRQSAVRRPTFFGPRTSHGNGFKTPYEVRHMDSVYSMRATQRAAASHTNSLPKMVKVRLAQICDDNGERWKMTY